MGGPSKTTQCLAKTVALHSFIYILHQGLHSLLSSAHCRAAYTVIPMLNKAIFTPSIIPNLSLPRSCPPLASDICTFLDIQYSSIHFTCSKHLKTLRSALLINSLSIPALSIRTSSFPALHDTPTKLLKHLISRTFTFLLSALLIPQATAAYNAVGTIPLS